jgi:hypothetical protein
MARLALAAGFGIVVGVVAGAAIGIRAQDAPDRVELRYEAPCLASAGCTSRPDLLNDLMPAADEAGISAADLLGAVNATGLTPRAYLCAVGELACPTLVERLPATGWLTRVRLTYYTITGITYGGGRPYVGSTACSWNFRLGTRFMLPSGETVICNDRGLLGSSGWLDLFARPDLVRRYGPYANVQVVP